MDSIDNTVERIAQAVMDMRWAIKHLETRVLKATINEDVTDLIIDDISCAWDTNDGSDRLKAKIRAALANSYKLYNNTSTFQNAFKIGSKIRAKNKLTSETYEGSVREIRVNGITIRPYGEEHARKQMFPFTEWVFGS